MSKPQSPTDKTALMRTKRDAKVHDHLSQYAPVWIADEQILLDKDAIQFEVVFYHPHYKWVKRRYFFDSYNHVLYHRGQIALDEDDTLALQNSEPYLSAEMVNTVNSYGG